MDISPEIEEKKEIATMLKSLLETEFKEIKEAVFLRFSEFEGTGKTYRDPKGHPIIEINLNHWLKWPTKISWIRANRELLRHECLHILTNRRDSDSEFIKEAKKRDIIGGDDFLLEYYQNKKGNDFGHN